MNDEKPWEPTPYMNFARWIVDRWFAVYSSAANDPMLTYGQVKDLCYVIAQLLEEAGVELPENSPEAQQ